MQFPKIALLIAVALSSGLFAKDETRPHPTLPDGLYAEFTAADGTMIARLFADEVPMTVANFVGLAEGTLGPKRGESYYAGLTWYRVVAGFVIQSGDPAFPAESDAGYTFPDEFRPGLRHDAAGILSMANAGPDTNSAEFFITLGEQTRLNYLHSVFGRVVSGAELLPRIKQGDAFSLKILRLGAAAAAFKADEASFKSLVARAPAYSGETAPGAAAHVADPDHLLPVTPPRAEAFNIKLNNFQRATGVRIVARFFAHSPTAKEDAVAGAFMRTLAENLGVAKRGALVAYFADEDDWRIWLGDESTSAFFGRTASAGDLGEGGAFHDVKETFLAATRAEGDAAFFAQEKAAAPGKSPSPAQRRKLQADAVLDRLIERLEPRQK